MYCPDELEGVTAKARLQGLRAIRANHAELADLRTEVDRLRVQNAKMKSAMRHCIDCDYRVEIMNQRVQSSENADGSGAAGDRGIDPTGR
jgi:hypothetical protein